MSDNLSVELDALVQRFGGTVHTVQPRLPLHLLRAGRGVQKGGIGASLGLPGGFNIDPAAIIAAAAQISIVKLIVLSSVPVAIQFIRSSEKVLVAWLQQNRLELRAGSTAHKLSRPKDVQPTLGTLEKAAKNDRGPSTK